MKYILIALLISSPVFAKENYNYTCPVDKDRKVEISLLDKNVPTISVFYKNKKFATCLYENTPMSQMSNPRAHVQDSAWQLKQKSCTTYIEKHKDEIVLNTNATFVQGYKGNQSYIIVVKNQQPYNCVSSK